MRDFSETGKLNTYFADISSYIFTQSNLLGASDVSVSISKSHGYEIVVADGVLENVDFHGGYDLTTIIYLDEKKLVFSTSDLRKTELKSLLKRIFSKIGYIEKDKYAGLPNIEFFAKDYVDLSLYFFNNRTIEQQISLALQSEKYSLTISKDIKQCEEFSISANHGYHFLMNSRGFTGHYNTSLNSISCCMLSAESNGNMHRDYYYTTSRNHLKLEPANTVVDRAVAKTLSRIGACSISPRKTSVLFSAETTKSIISYFLAAISGSNIYKKSSFLIDCIGKQIFSKCVDITDDPTTLSGFGSSYFDAEGVATKKRKLVDAGVLQGYLLSSYTARQLNMETTGNCGGYHNINIKPNSGNNKEMFSKLENGIYVTEFMGQGVDLVTGDFSKGCFGYLVENGKIQRAVNEITVAANLKDIFKNIVAIGNEVDMRGSIITGPILVTDIVVAGKNEI